MFYLILPWGKNFGWGVCGKYLTKELSRIAPVRLVSTRFDPQAVDNEMEYRFFKQLLATPEEIELLRRQNTEYPVLQAIGDHHLQPTEMPVTAPRKVGYTFFESVVPDSAIPRAREYFDVVATGCSWCTRMLQEKGLNNATTVIQGIDPLIFNSSFRDKELFRDRFVVFSGGKFELRKGHDLVIRAYQVLQDRHADVMLVASWYNMWGFSMESMAASPHIRFQMKPGDFIANTKELLRDNGIDLDRVLVLPLYKNETMARIYQNTDVGLFPNRCEGGTNLVLMEYMACGKPVIASCCTGHTDIVNDRNALVLHPQRTVSLMRDGKTLAVWPDLSLDETIEQLEWAYQNRSRLQSYAYQGGLDLAAFTWRRSAEQFEKLLRGSPG